MEETERANSVSGSMISGDYVSNGKMGMHMISKYQIITELKGGQMKNSDNIHPGEILLEEFLKPMSVTAYRLAKETKIDQTRVSEIIRGKRSISIDTALRFAKFFGNSPEFWINLQIHYELEVKKLKLKKELQKIKEFKLGNENSIQPA